MKSIIRFCLAGTCSVGVLTAVSIADAAAAHSNVSDDHQPTCVMPVGDLNDDGVVDHAASTNRARDGWPAAYVFFGPEPLPEVVDLGTADLVLRGVQAVLFSCPDAAQPAGTTMQRERGTEPQQAAPRPRPPSARRKSGDVRPSPIGEPIQYTMIDLAPLMPGYSEGVSGATSGINANGDVVGRYFRPEGEHAFVYSEGELRDLGTLGGHISDARDVNDAGVIVGYSLTGEVDTFGFVHNAFVSDGTSLQDLGIRWSEATAINNAGHIVGGMQVRQILPDFTVSHAFLLEDGTLSDLGALPVAPGHVEGSAASSINEAGQIVGSSATFTEGPTRLHTVNHAFLYENGVMRDLGTLGKTCHHFEGPGEVCYDSSFATDINNHGLVVGFSTSPAVGNGGHLHAFATDGQSAWDLGTFGGSGSAAYGVNDSGQIVGIALDAEERYKPFLVDRGVMYDLNTLVREPTGPLPFAAYAINNFGQIAGNHHLLSPEYESIAPRQPLTFTAALGTSLDFEYWLARGSAEEERSVAHPSSSDCSDLGHKRLRIQLRIDTTLAPGKWSRAAVLPGCGSSTDWRTVSVSLPRDAVNTEGRVRIRLQSGAADDDTVVYLRHFTTNYTN